jgi:hypothetical protein
MSAPLLLSLFGAYALFALQAPRPERFDTSGMPRRPTNFVEQQISEMIASHKWGDLQDAARIQRKLGRYYADRGDEQRATTAFLAAAAAERPGTDQTVPEKGAAHVPATPAPELKGGYYGYAGKTLHIWEFNSDGTFLHTWIGSGAGASVRNSERGSFRVRGEELELNLSSAAAGFVTPGVGNRTTLAGGAQDKRTDVCRLKFVRSEDGIVLDGLKLKPKGW